MHAGTSCGGTSKVTVLKSTTLTLSRHGRIKKSPGPLAFPDVSRPRRRITALSYSFTIYTSACVCVRITKRHDPRARSLIFYQTYAYLDRYKQRQRKEHNDQYERKHGHNVAAASQPLLGRCSYLVVCKRKKIAHESHRIQTNNFLYLPPALPGLWRSSCSFWGAISPRDAIARTTFQLQQLSTQA